MTLLAVFNVMLSVLSGQEDIVVGAPVAARTHADLQDIIGMFVNTLAVRNFPSGTVTFADFLRDVRTRSLDDFRNQDYPFEELVDILNLERDTARNPLFDVMFNFLNLFDEKEFATDKNGQKRTKDGEDVGEKDGEYDQTVVANFDLDFTGMEQHGSIAFQVTYCSKLFRAETVKRFIDYFKRILEAVIARPGAYPAEIEFISEDERSMLLETFNNTSEPFPFGSHSSRFV